ncbi:MAG: hypothetical protein M3340_02085 [Actinomycetota bacterium]|nr:hypothetical protein [Actinomycetota bacterium]
MQAITVAIGPVGVTYFGQTLLASDLMTALTRLTPPGRSIDAPDFRTTGLGWSDDYTKIKINLSNGSLSSFTPTFAGISQKPGGQFQVALSAANFNANYSWSETWHEWQCSYGRGGHCNNYDKAGGPFGYSPRFGNLAVQLQLAFKYDQGANAYQVGVAGTTASPSGVVPNVPAGSVIQQEQQDCFTNHVSDATAGAVAAIDFGAPVAALFGPLFKSIPASGHLTPDITYDFSVGDSGMTFPGDQGLAIGVTGAVTYKGEKYPGTPPPALPVPPVPTDANHLRAYVSSYEFDALNWAFFKAGLLTVTVNPDDLVDPDVLKVKNYAKIAAFKPYLAFAMQAHVAPKQAPTTSFQTVWEFTKANMQLLKQQIPTTEFAKLAGIDGNNYLSKADLEEDLGIAKVGTAQYAAIERVTQAMGMVVRHDLDFKLTIQNGDADPPNLVFELVRTDILGNLSLGVTGSAQTLMFDFHPVKADATFVSTTVPKFDSKDFGDWIWPNAGEPAYDKLLTDMGTKTGVPLPIMQGFHFLFEHAQLSVQEGYVSVLAQVEFKRSTAPAELQR